MAEIDQSDIDRAREMCLEAQARGNAAIWRYAEVVNPDLVLRLLSSEEERQRLDAPDLARRFHEAYERLAPSFGYETRKASAVPWDQVPEANRKLMIAVCAEVFGLSTEPPPHPKPNPSTGSPVADEP